MKHWTDDDFLDHLYELRPADRHLEECSACRAAFQLWMAARERMRITPQLAAPEITVVRERPLRWVAAAALACSALLVILFEPPPAVETARHDAQLMADIYRTVYDAEPAAIEPLRGLFEERR